MRMVSIGAGFKAGFFKILLFFIPNQIKTMLGRKKYTSTGLGYLRVWPEATANI